MAPHKLSHPPQTTSGGSREGDSRLAELLAERERYVPRGVFNVAPTFLDTAHGATLTDVTGRSFIDFAGGLGVLNAGHTPERVVKAVQEQAARYLHGCFHVTMYEPYVKLAKTLAERTPGKFDKKVMFTNSGAEAVENAVKIAKAFTGRKAIIVFEHGFHGRTQLTMTMTSKVKPYKFGFGTLAPDVHRAPYAYCYRCPLGQTPDSCATACANQLDNMLETHLAPEEVAAVVMEPVVGEGGFIVPPPEFIRKVYDICKKHGIVFIADEVQSGIGRTGKLFAIEHSGVEPDIIIASKSLASGMPLGAVIGRSEIMDAPMVGGLGGTFGGNPVSCAAALATLETIDAEKLCERATAIGARCMERFKGFQQKYPHVGDIRGLGAMLAIELVKDRATKAPAKEQAAKLIKLAFERGLILLKAGVHDNVIRILVPLVVDDATLDAGLDIIDRCLEEVK